MSTHSLSDVHDKAPLYAVNALLAEEAREFEAHLEECESCREEVRSLSKVTEDLAIASAAVPSPSLRSRVLERVSDDRMESGRLALEGGALQFARGAGIPWEEGKVPGVQFKLLHRDRVTASSTKLVRLAPGTAYPSHRHGGVEELFVIEGDLLVSGILMRAGDYCRAEAGTKHTDISTTGGVLFFGMSSDQDEALD
jgi:quercetin dioxygenase-like cupin family protein